MLSTTFPNMIDSNPPDIYLTKKPCSSLGLNFVEYQTRAIIARGLHIFYSIFDDHFFVFKEFFSENSVLMYHKYSRAFSYQEQAKMACVQ